MGLADLHTHTSVSDGMMDVRALLRHVELSGALEAREIAAGEGYRFQVIVGEEVTTRAGHLIGLFLQGRIPRLRSLEATLRMIHDQGGIAIVPHPMSWLTFSVGQRSV